MVETTSRNGQTTSVVLVDDHEFLLEGLKQRFDDVDDVTVIGTADTMVGGVDAVRRLEPDFAIVDFRLPDGNGIALVDQIRAMSPATKCIIYTSVTFSESVEHQAHAVVTKELFNDQLVDTIRQLRAGSNQAGDGTVPEV